MNLVIASYSTHGRYRLVRGAALAGLALLALAGAGKPGPAAASPVDAVTVTAPNNTTIAESDDYATQVLGNPWDMNSVDDVDYLDHMTPASVSNGIWSSQSTNAYASIFLKSQGWDNSMESIGERSGANYPIVSSRFSHLRFRMYSSVADRMVVYWFPRHSFTQGGNSNFLPTQAGWHIYDIDLNATGNSGSATWFNGNWSGLRLDPVTGLGHTGATIQLDWARLTPATGSSTTVSWTGSGNSPVSLYLATSPTGPNEMLLASGLPASGSYTWNTAGMAAGTYYIHAVLGAASGSSGPLNVNQAPVLNLTSPSPSSGEDFAQTRLGYPWALSNLSQLRAWYNLANIGFGPGYMTAQATNNDPELWFSNWDTTVPIDANRYHYLSYNALIARPPGNAGGQYPQWNAGPRTMWAQSNAPLNWQITKASIAWYDRPIHVAMDLRNPQILEPGSNQGWVGSERIFRIDPHEEDGALGSGVIPPFFHIGQVRLTADPTATNGGLTTISWVPSKQNGTVTLSYSTSPAGGGTAFAQVPLGQGGYLWALNGLAPGSYWITANVSDGLNTFGQVSPVPLIVSGTHPCPSNFGDVPPSNPFYTYINNLSCRNITEGYSDNSFRPNANATRGDLARWVVLARGWGLDSGGAGHFADVPDSDPNYAYVETAYRHGVLSGYADGTFHPYDVVTRGQMSKMIVNAMGWAIDTSGGPHFNDVPSTNPFYLQIETIYHHGAVSGYADGSFRWGNALTRGQLSKVLYVSVGP